MTVHAPNRRTRRFIASLARRGFTLDFIEEKAENASHPFREIRNWYDSAKPVTVRLKGWIVKLPGVKP